MSLGHSKVFPESDEFIQKREKLTTKFLRRSFQKSLFSVNNDLVVILPGASKKVFFVADDFKNLFRKTLV
tara:strand:- start:1152 stop:1361 length:210 start_codon:yes stop_codon:yes gene_type:complete